MIPRKSYTVHYKLEILRMVDNHSISVISHKFNIAKSNICKWKQQRVKLRSINNQMCRKIGSGRKVSNPEVEEQLYSWTIEKRDQLYPLTLKDICNEMKRINSDSKASTGWLYGFLKRFQLSLHSITEKVLVRRQTGLRLHQTRETLIHSFKSFLSENIEKFQLSPSHIFNMDQTPVWFNMTPYRVVNPIGSKKTIVKIPGSTKLDKVTVCLTVRKDGLKLPPLIVFQSSRRNASFERIGNVYICKNSKTSMMNSELVSRWLEILFSVDTTSSTKRLLIMDSFRGHLTRKVEDTCDSLNIIRSIIPGGLTSELQPLDRTVNRSFKSKMRDLFKREMNSITSHSPTTNISQWNRQLMIQAVSQAWSFVEEQTIKNGFHCLD